MSPSSAGVKPVQTNGIEQYIGSYLISTSARPKYNQKNKNIYVQKTDHKPQSNQRNYNNNHVRPHNNEGWVGGGTIYSVPNYQIHGNVRKSTPHLEDFHQQSLTRLAIHTHGVPLILAGKNYRKNNYPQKCNSDVRYTKQSEYSKVNCQIVNSDVKDNCVIDTISVTSDESSGSNNSENCLPRIIKPRKRRKKDRKPSVATLTVTESEESTTTKSDDVPNLNHEFKDVKEVQIQCSPTSCQCKLCDPSGQIWNIDTSYASKIYTPPPIGIDTCIVDKMVTALRRSWNEEPGLSNTLHQENVSANVGVIGQGRLSRERKDSETSITSISAQITHSNVTANNSSSQNLNISTEIVTSANGQKDLEIKFLSFSCSNLNDACSDSYFSKPYPVDKIVKPFYEAKQTCFNPEE